jgi:hypothetical protein
MAKLEIAVLIGGESKQFLADLEAVVGRLEKAMSAQTTANDEDAPEEKTVRSVAKNKAAAVAKKAAKSDDDEAFDLGAEESNADDEAPEVTKKDLIAACRDNRETAIKVLKKLKVSSVHDLKPNQYAKVLAEIGA